MKPQKIFSTEILIKPSKGIGLRTTWWSDGSVTSEEFVMCMIPIVFLIGY